LAISSAAVIEISFRVCYWQSQLAFSTSSICFFMLLHFSARFIRSAVSHSVGHQLFDKRDVFSSNAASRTDNCFTKNADWSDAVWTAGRERAPKSFVWNVVSAAGTTTSELTYADWIQGQPDSNRIRPNDGCLAIWKSQNWKFDDASCSFRTCFVCEIDL
jgi:hypothetical protein